MIFSNLEKMDLMWITDRSLKLQQEMSTTRISTYMGKQNGNVIIATTRTGVDELYDVDNLSIADGIGQHKNIAPSHWSKDNRLRSDFQWDVITVIDSGELVNDAKVLYFYYRQ